MVVLPKRKALAQANQDLAAARAKLAELKAKLQVSFSVNEAITHHHFSSQRYHWPLFTFIIQEGI